MRTMECLWIVCHMGTFQLLEVWDKGSKPNLLILAEEVLSRDMKFQIIEEEYEKGLRRYYSASLASLIVLNTDRSHYLLFGTLRLKGRQSGTQRCLLWALQCLISRNRKELSAPANKENLEQKLKPKPSHPKLKNSSVGESLLRGRHGQQLLAYLKKDVHLLGGVMLKAQEIYWNLYKIDIVDTIMLSSLALSIYRMHYDDPKSWTIHIATRNQERFIRRGYYGGHADGIRRSSRLHQFEKVNGESE
ncbi:dna polymerase [Nicotiana attenuata]|uniref:DNA-directed DNA polymerase n=1 Tax=Nicotiana attenuata TaxID=49451 RepID=A0A314KPS9_NICAT|nr:dna polymerase [Nicotiana attenuata]